MKSFGKKKITIVLLVIVIVIFIVVMIPITRYYRYLSEEMNNERSTMLTEICEKNEAAIQTMVDGFWTSVKMEAYMMANRDIADEDTMMDMLNSLKAGLGYSDEVFAVVDDKGYYHSSNNLEGVFPEPDALMIVDKKSKIEIKQFDNKPGVDQIVFIRKLDNPVTIGEITVEYAVIGMDVEDLIKSLDLEGFSSSAFYYLVKRDGTKINSDREVDFLPSDNIFMDLEQLQFEHGGSVDDIRVALSNKKVISESFSVNQTEWYVSCCRFKEADWDLLLFADANYLGANLSSLMNNTIIFFVILTMVMLMFFILIVVMLYRSYKEQQVIIKQQEESLELRLTAEEAVRANAAKSAFLSHMSHDIRTPINGVMGMTGIAKKHIDDKERVADCLNKIDESSKHLLSLVNDVLDISRIEAGKVEAVSEPFELIKLMDNCGSIIQGQLLDKQVEFEMDYEGIVHNRLLGDELHLRQIFINILGNSAKFTSDGDKIMFRAFEEPEENSKIKFRFEFEDTGIGMSEEFLPKLFEEFSQAENDGRTKYVGTGLGMSITKKFTELLGGTINVESKLGEGTKFTIVIPMEEDPDKDRDKKREKRVFVELTGLKVLLVEDNELNQEIAMETLEDEGAVVTTADNGQMGVDTFAASMVGYFDVILMDIMMPVMNGLDAARAIRALDREDAKTVPIIALTANAYDEDRKNALEAGMNNHLAKPVDPDILLKTLVDDVVLR